MATRLNQSNQQRRLGSQTAAGGAAGGTSFQQRLNSIIQRASAGGQQDQIQVFGQTKIIADQRSNSLLIFATRPDMERIKAVIEKLDVLLAQVLIESVIMGVDLEPFLELGRVSGTESNNASRSTPNIIGGGGMNNGQTFLFPQQRFGHQFVQHLWQQSAQRLQLFRQYRPELGRGVAGGGRRTAQPR